MKTTIPRSRWRKVGKIVLLTAVIGVILLAGAAWYTTTDSFQSMVHSRLVAQLERMTGGRVELKGFQFSPVHFRAELDGLTIHGKEAEGEEPFVHVDHLIAHVKIISLLRTDFGFHSVIVDHPTVHIMVYPDGTTNQPAPQISFIPGESPVEPLFSLSVNRLEVRHGIFLFNDQKIPVDFAVNDLSLDMNYSLLERQYVGNVLFGKAETRFDGYRPVPWTAEAHFTLGRQHVELKSLKGTSNKIHVTASGKLENFQQPRIEATYSVTADLAQAGAIARRSEVRSGTLQASGRGSWSTQGFSSTGNLSIENFGWRDPALNVQNAKASAQYAVNQDRLTLSQIAGRLLGGSINGDVDVTNWLAAGSRNKNGEQKGSARLRVKGIAVAEAVKTFATSSLPLDRAGLTGSVDGSVEARWRGRVQNSEVVASLNVAPPATPSSNQLPVTAHGQFTYRGASGELEVDEFTANTRSTRITASGVLNSRAGLKVSASTTDPNEWQPILNAFGTKGKLPVTLHGEASFHGTATGQFSDVTLSGNLHAEDFDALVPATQYTPERQVHWDDLSANLQVSPHAIVVHNGTLRHGASEVSFDFNLGLHRGQFVPDSTVNARVDARNTDLAELLSLAGYNYPVIGTMNLRAEVTGTKAEPTGTGHVEISNATIYGQKVQSFKSRLGFNHGELQMEGLDLQHDDSHVTGTVAYNFSSKGFRADLAGANFDLASVPRLKNDKVAIEGRMDFTAKGSGTLQEPAVNAHLDLKNLLLNRRHVGDFALDATTQGADLHLSGKSQFEQAELTVDGDIRMRGDWDSNIKVHFNQLNADPILASYMKASMSGHATITGDVSAQGPLRQPRALNFTGNLSDFQLTVEDLKFSNQGPVQFSVANQVLNIQQFHLTGERTDLTASGTVQLTGERRLDLKAHGRANLRLIETLDRDFNSSGIVTVDMTVAGTVSTPAAQGRLSIANGGLAHVDYPNALSEINGSLIFNQDRLQIETLTARTGGGQVTFQGYAAAHNHQIDFDLTAHGEEVRVRYPPGVSSTANLDLRFTGNSAASNLTGDVTITRLGVTPGFDFGTYLARSSQASTLTLPDPTLNRIRLDIHILTTPELQMQTAVVRLSGDADLRLRGTAGKPALLGRVDVTEGQIFFNGGKYQLERGEVTFISPAAIKPVLDLQMTTRVRDYDITVSLNGEPDKLKLKYRSEPPLPEGDIVTLLALGRTREESAQLSQTGSLGGEASSAILSEALNATVSSRIQRLFGGSRIKIDPQGLATETNPSRGPQVTIDQQVTNNLTLTYSTNVAQSSQQIIQLEYNVSRNLSILAVRDQNGVVSFDVRIRRQKK